MYKSLALAMAAVAAALPQSSYGGSSPPKHMEFALAMTVNGTYVSLNFTPGPGGVATLQAQRLSVYPGTPAFFAGTGDEKALNLDVKGATWNLIAPEVGDNYGYAALVAAEQKHPQYEWSANNGTIYHTLDAALDQFFACKRKTSEGENYFLAFGVQQSNGQAPDGCLFTTLVQNFNVPGGATGPTTQ